MSAPKLHQHNTTRSLSRSIDRSIVSLTLCPFVCLPAFVLDLPPRPCPLPHVDYEDRPPCESFARYGACPRGEACWYPHIAMTTSTKQTAERPKAAILTSRVYACRLAVRAQELLQRLGDGSENVCHIVGHVSASAKPKADVALLLDREGWSSDQVLARVLSDGDLRGCAIAAFRCDGLAETLEDAAAGAACELAAMGSGAGVARLSAFPPSSRGAASEALRGAGVSIFDPTTAAAGSGHHDPAPRAVVDVVAASKGGKTLYYWGVRGEEAAMASGVPLLSEGGRLFLDEGRTARMRRENAVCRAYFKLEEALRVAGVRVGGGWTCLDIGASPGGWSQCLCRRLGGNGRVVAVDPAALQFSDTKMVHLPVLAEDTDEFRERVRLASEGRKIDLIACDANVNPNLSARLALSLLPLQQSARAVLVLSLKNFVGRRKRWEREIAEIAELVEGSGYERVRVVHLFNNAPMEKTLVATRMVSR